MNRKTPSKLKKDLETACDRINRLANLLEAKSIDSQWNLGSECSAAAAKLRDVLKQNEIPTAYKVAVIGRFKAGKSSFVNELLERQLAGEDTSPETAAITTFRNGDEVRATINLIDRAVWDELKKLHELDESDPNAHRFANWMKFSKGVEPGTGRPFEFDLRGIERDLVHVGGHSREITLSSLSRDSSKKQESQFRRSLKEYTSSTKPYHCLVESIEIQTPSTILGEGVILLDTPGLDDTERFRVQLTEKAVENVDAVLFLTKSGAAYGQSEKEFLLSLLRRGTVKQLIFVVTQVDHTYDQHVKQRQHEDEEPEPISQRIEAERVRLRGEIEATLDELEKASGGASMQRYREQLGAIEIAFTSATNHRDWLKKEPVRFPLAAADPGGMNQIRQILFSVLATESRLAAAKDKIQADTVLILQQLLALIEGRRSAVRNLKNREVAEEKLGNFRDQFSDDCSKFSAVTLADAQTLKVALENRAPIEKLASENVVLHAQAILGAYESDDAGRHWRTRRGGNWGYLHQFQLRVANKIFPTVAQQLNEQTEEFSRFIAKFRLHLKALSDRAGETKRALEFGSDVQLDIAGELEKFLDGTLGSLQELITGEENKIVTLLEDFIDQKVEDEISKARQSVSGIWGKGTVVNQNVEVRGFYKRVVKILSDALRGHVLGRFAEFSQNLHQQAAALPNRALSHAGAEIERVSADIRAAAEAAIAGQKEIFERLAEELTSEIGKVVGEVRTLLDWVEAAPSMVPSEPTALGGPQEEEPDRGELQAPVIRLDDPAEIRTNAQACVARFSLQNNATGWTFDKIFAPKFLKGAVNLWLIEPFLVKGHQRRNFSEFVRAACSAAKLKSISVQTKVQDSAELEQVSKFLEAFDRDLYEQIGCRVSVSFSEDLHDRFVVLDNGNVFKLGRGLDIYKSASGLAAANASLRKVKECEIDVFAPEKVRGLH